jgi:hypothetical protein
MLQIDLSRVCLVDLGKLFNVVYFIRPISHESLWQIVDAMLCNAGEDDTLKELNAQGFYGKQWVSDSREWRNNQR